MFESHPHPLDPSKKVIGRHLEIGEVLRSSDQCAGETKWEAIAYELIGTTVKPDQCNMFIRPV